MATIVQLISSLRTDKFGNALNKLQNLKTDFKHSKTKPELHELWICTKSYKVGTFDHLVKFCNEAKQKKNGIIVNPYN